jgi:Ion channel
VAEGGASRAQRVAKLSPHHPIVDALHVADSYGTALVLLLITFFLLFLADDASWLRVLATGLLGLTLVTVIVTSRGSTRLVRIAYVAAGATFLVVLIEALVGSDHKPVVGFAALGALTILSPLIVLKRILGHDRVTIETLLGAICVYLLVGMAFAFALLFIAYASPSAVVLVGGPESPSTAMYLSFITLTTVGFGDVTPGTDGARALSVIEALLGQVFLVTLIARLVSLFQPRRGPRSDDPPEDPAPERD